MSAKDGGPAFPTTPKGEIVGGVAGGMSLRDWFAGQALAAVLRLYAENNDCGIGTDHLLRNCPIHAYRIADAMLAAREKED